MFPTYHKYRSVGKCDFSRNTAHAKIAIKDEAAMIDRLLSFAGQEANNKKTAKEKTLRNEESRIQFIEDASRQLFEEKIAGNVPDSLFKKMFADYEKELA